MIIKGTAYPYAEES